jgi:hypothetical protein
MREQCETAIGPSKSGGIRRSTYSSLNNAALATPDGAVAYTPAPVDDASSSTSRLGYDRTGLVMGFVDTYDNPLGFAALDPFNSAPGTTDSGSLYEQYCL